MAAKQKRPSMLARQRQLRKQQQATKAASRNQLPSAGNTTASSTRAQAQRVGTAVRQRANQDMAVIRALADNMKRNQARSDRQIKPDPSPKTRYVGPGGANPKANPLPPGNKGGQMQAKGGPMVKAGSSQVTPGQRNAPAQQVRVQDLGNTKESNNKPASQRGLGSGSNRSLPSAGNSGGSRPPRGTTAPQRGGPQRTAAQASSERRSAAASRAAGSARGSGANNARVATGGVNRSSLASTLFPIAQQARDSVMRRAGVPEGVMKLQEGLDNAINTAGASIPGDLRRLADSRKRPQRTAQPLPSTNPEEAKNYPRLGQYGAPVTVSGKPQQKPSQSPTRSSGRTAETQSGGRPRSASQQPTSSVPSAPRAPKAPPAPRAAQSAPKAPDSPSMSGVGPTKDGSLYADKLKISQIEGGKEPDMERRRAFLDAKDSMSGLKAVKDLLAKRKKRMGEG